MTVKQLQELTKLIRYFILVSTTEAGSGHPTSSLSAVELMTVLFFDGFLRYDLKDPANPNNDRVIFSKGHASPLFYAMYTAAGAITEKELLTLRKFGSRLEGHPTLEFPYTQVPTGSLGQGISVGVGMAINAKYLDKIPAKTYVLLGDSEIAEGSVWEALQIAHHYKLNNLVAILDANRLGQSKETLDGHDIKTIAKKFEAFGWEVITVNGHSLPQIQKAFTKAQQSKDKPVMIVAKTYKGRGISFLEDKENWHGKPLNTEQLQDALKELGNVDTQLLGKIAKPKTVAIKPIKKSALKPISYDKGQLLATRRAYGNALTRIMPAYPNAVVLDAETSNSTFSAKGQDVAPDRFFEMYIAEQNMVGTAVGLSRVGKIPFISTFAAFFSRAFDQIRMSQYSDANIKFIGSHAGVSIGEDGASQMGLEDISMFRVIFGSVVLYPSDAVSTEKLVEEATTHHGVVYIRTTRSDTPVLYANDEQFPIGGSKTVKQSKSDTVTVIGAGITLHEALAAYEVLKKDSIMIRVIDLYSIKPLDVKTLKKAAKETKAIITVEDHFEEGGIGEAVKAALVNENATVHSLAVRKMPHSGKPKELLDYEDISANAIVKKVKELLKNS
ncbi:MAG TPA: transketolase [Candidatus Acidoferrales bacterium]|nr:transketolase [Candidatus Acidoferrales bacterium]